MYQAQQVRSRRPAFDAGLCCHELVCVYGTVTVRVVLEIPMYWSTATMVI